MKALRHVLIGTLGLMLFALSTGVAGAEDKTEDKAEDKVEPGFAAIFDGASLKGWSVMPRSVSLYHQAEPHWILAEVGPSWKEPQIAAKRALSRGFRL